MTARTRKSEQRIGPLSRERIVAETVELLDAVGESGLTFRALTEWLNTGPGAIYWHIANKRDLMVAAADAVVGATLPEQPAGASPREAIRAVALGLFDAIEKHPWLAGQLTTQLSQGPWRSATPRVIESIARQVGALGVPRSGWFNATFALVHYILGAAAQNASNALVAGPGVDRDEYLDAASTAWKALDPAEYPFTRAMADQLPGHDDRAEFLAGVDLILTGITARLT